LALPIHAVDADLRWVLLFGKPAKANFEGPQSWLQPLLPEEENTMSVAPMIRHATVLVVLTIAVSATNEVIQGGELSPKTYNIDSFFSTIDADKDSVIGKDEWTGKGLMDVSFALCDGNKDDKIAKQEMTACAIPESMDIKKEGILTVFAGGRFVIPSPGKPVVASGKFPPGITQVTQFVADSPYVEGGPTGMAFIKLLDQNGDGKVSHAEWEAVKNNTVFKPFRWPQYNKNRDEWITVDEAPQPSN
jgi:hypothetical protein